MKNIAWLTLFTIILTLFAACGPSAAPPAAPAADIVGQITAIQPAEAPGDLIGSVLIEGTREENPQYDRASVRITAETRILQGDDRQPVTFEALETGQRVEARFSGPVMESYPVQALAGEIVILEQP